MSCSAGVDGAFCYTPALLDSRNVGISKASLHETALFQELSHFPHPKGSSHQWSPGVSCNLEAVPVEAGGEDR